MKSALTPTKAAKHSTLPERKLQTVKDTAAQLGFSDRHIRRLITAERLRAVGLGRGLRVIAASVDEFIEAESQRRMA